MNESKVNAIVNLLEDPSLEVQKMMKDQLKKLAVSELVDLCDKAREINLDISLQVDQIRKEKLFDASVVELETMVSNSQLDMESLALFLACFIDPAVNKKDIESSLNTLAEDCREYLDLHFDEDEAHALARYLGVECGFTGNTKHYYAVGNSSLHFLIENKRALPITLSVLYIILGKRLNIDIKGIAIPAHFIVSVENGDDVTYINPFESGKIMSLENCRALTRRAGYPFTDEVMEPVDSRPIFMRMLNNLKFVYSREGKIQEAKAVTRLLKIWAERVFRQVP